MTVEATSAISHLRLRPFHECCICVGARLRVYLKEQELSCESVQLSARAKAEDAPAPRLWIRAESVTKPGGRPPRSMLCGVTAGSVPWFGHQIPVAKHEEEVKN